MRRAIFPLSAEETNEDAILTAMKDLRLDNLTLGYGAKEVVRDMCFDVKPGEMVGIVGPNGSGKSTIMKALSRVIKPKSGRIIMDGRDIGEISRKELSNIVGVVPQNPVLPSAFTAFEIVLMGRSPHLRMLQNESPEDIDIAWKAMESTGVTHLAERKIGELSGGEIQSVIIARAITQQTEAIFLDEPTSNLDVGRQIEILDLIKQLQEEKQMIVIAALHDLNLAAHYCDKLVLIDKGKLFAIGKPTEVIKSEIIQKVYGSGNIVHVHPVSGLPAVLPMVGGSKNRRKRFS